jgi:MOSC domain-containing protein YiiM
MNNGELKAIWIKRMKRGPMDTVTEAKLIANRGIVGNANQGGRRQVTIIEAEIWQELMEKLHCELDPSTRRANLMVSGIKLFNSRHRIMHIGNCRIRILGETKPCERMDEAVLGLKAAMYPEWGGGAFGQVIDDGEIAVGDIVQWDKIERE